jgi:hypothetical protein
VGDTPRKENLVIDLGHQFIVNEVQLGDNDPPMEVQILVKVGNGPYDHMTAVEGHGVPSIDQALEVGVTTDQSLKH